MQNTIDKLKFNITTPNAATQLMSSGFVPNGEAKKNGWEEVTGIKDSMVLAIAGMFKSVMELAGDLRKLSKAPSALVARIYSSIEQDIKTTAEAINAVAKLHAEKFGFFRSEEDTMLAQRIVLEYQGVFERTHALTMPMMVELQAELMEANKIAQASSDLLNPAVISDAIVK